MKIKAFYHQPTYTLTYLVWDDETKDAVIIDPVLDFDPIGWQTSTASVEIVENFVRSQGLRLHLVLETHAHADHLSASQYLKSRLEAQVAISKHIATVQQTFKPIFGLDDSFLTRGEQFDRLFDDGEVLEAGALKVEVIATPGHTPACVTFKIGDALFTGDALFMHDYGTGRCDFPGGSAKDLFQSLEKLYALPNDTRVFVGHDYQPGGRALAFETTIEASKASNPYMRSDTTEAAFVSKREARDKQLSAPKLLFQSVQVNIAAGNLPPVDGATRRLAIPLNMFGPTDDVGKRR